MSEYQCYEFVALDRPLTQAEMAELRSISTRADIAPTRFWNEYQWGDLKADPKRLLARYFDAFLYFANWASHRFMLRLPASQVDLRQLKPYFPGGPSTLTKVGKHLVVDLWSDSEEPEDDWFEARGRLGALVPLRAELLQGDMSAAYLAWLLAVQAEDVTRSAKEPPVPAGLREPNASLIALAEFLRIDRDLVAAAAEGSQDDSLNAEALRSWIRSRPAREKDRWLLKAVDDASARIGTDLIVAFRREQPMPPRKPRTVSALLARADEIRLVREAAEAKQAEKDRRRTDAARKKHLAALTKQRAKAWTRLERLLEDRKYDEAVKLTLDLRDAAVSLGRTDDFETRIAVVREQHARRRGYLDRLKVQLGRVRGERL
jgi:hypothetical protein